VLYSWGLRQLMLVAPLLAALLSPTLGPVAALALVASLAYFVSARQTHLDHGRGIDNDHVHEGIGGHDDKREDGDAAALQR
jgi:hypothetical protein